jgi:hypothetical protein
MVNRRLPQSVRARPKAHCLSVRTEMGSSRFRASRLRSRALSQILPKLRSFKFSQNMSLIRFENGQKPPLRANGAFKPPC